MAYINLLPWRENAKKAQQKAFFKRLSTVMLAGIMAVFLISQFYQVRINKQYVRNQFLKDEIKLLDEQITKIKLLNKQRQAFEKRTIVVEQLQHSRNLVTQVLDEIANIVPQGIYLTRLEKRGKFLNIVGKSQSNSHLANMIKAIEHSDLFDNTVLNSIRANDKKINLLSDFKMKVAIKKLDNIGNNTNDTALTDNRLNDVVLQDTVMKGRY